ncbi:hypothetical protein SAMN05192574_12162 [Mucilaginibacter gossypiicola]|uniref:5-hmdU DNA kinase helical domain-containing protein n=1 Tax=Mucilaginibacter gossypiicola TaxID=551995 RepID=A0A1H8V0J6_9SPHI|nr:nucleotide kinase domain-containing protein [Mucilaginibacter gossypiicola]SEP08753.1 hypothetical protein SAMN05192574_12162 [Mucilaginibacter gossypiicola]
MTTHYTKKIAPRRSTVYDSYWLFAAERFKIFERRLSDPLGPWTKNKVISDHRFTNVFRASDRVSQYLINIQYQGDQIADVFFKTLLFKLFNKIETYQYLLKETNELSYRAFDFSTYDNLLTRKLLEGKTIYSAAYIIPSAGSAFGYKFKHSNHLALLNKMMDDRAYEKIQQAKSLQDVYKILLTYPSLGTFLAFQFAIDLNYSDIINFSENDFVVAGPGAKNGITKCFTSLGDYNFEDVIRLMVDDQQRECERLGLDTPNLWDRPLQLIDCQNLFCETDKYLRVTNPEHNQSGRTRIKQKFRKSTLPITLFFPPKWNLNEKIDLSCQKKTNAVIFS